MLVELSVVEQRYQAVLAVIRDGVKVVEVARRFDVSRQAVHRGLKRAGLIDPRARRRRDRKFKRWERGGAMELWQMDVVGGVLLADGRECKVLTGIDDHSRFVVCAGLMLRATSRAVCAHF